MLLLSLKLKTVLRVDANCLKPCSDYNKWYNIQTRCFFACKVLKLFLHLRTNFLKENGLCKYNCIYKITVA